jgi:hypothetical protein
MKRIALLFLVLAVVAAAPVLAQQPQAVVREATGKVEVKQPGKDWQPAAVDMVLARGAMVSTGFSSRLVLDVGRSRLTVSPLTRMSLDELVKKESTNTASLTLKVGKVNAVVKSAAGERTEFTLKGPASTAAVRGTEFVYNGYELQVIEGIVQFVNLLYQSRNVGPGDSSNTDGFNYPDDGEGGYSDDSNVTNPGGGLLPGGGVGGEIRPVLTGTISVVVQ